MPEALFIYKTDDEARDWENYIRRIFTNSTLHLIHPLFDFVKSWKILTENVARMGEINYLLNIVENSNMQRQGTTMRVKL